MGSVYLLRGKKEFNIGSLEHMQMNRTTKKMRMPSVPHKIYLAE